MKKIFYFLILYLTLFINNKVLALSIDSKSAILYNLNDNEIIYEKNSNDKTYVASLTKIMTALITLENINNLDEEIVVKQRDLLNLNGYAKAGFKVGDKVTYRDLLYGLLLSSGADAASILAHNVSASDLDFVSLMNQKVNMLGLSNTIFSNSIGMDEGNVSTASDIALILKEALKNNDFKTIFTTNEYITTNGLKLEKTTYKTSINNKIDTSIIIGSKTGYTDKALYCLASIASIDGVNYLAVTLNNENKIGHISDTLKLYDYYSNNYSYKTILKKNQFITNIAVKNSSVKEYQIKSNETIKKYLENSIDLNNIEYKYSGVNQLTKKIKKGDYLGKVDIIYDNKVLYTYKAYLEQDIKYYNYWLLLIPLAVIIVCSICIIRIIKIKKHKIVIKT